MDTEEWYQCKKSIKQDGTSERMDLSGKGLNDQALAELGQVLTKNITLGRLDLKGNNFGAEGVRALCFGLETNIRLVELDLSDNLVGPSGFGFLASWLGSTDALRILCINNAGITGEAASDQAIDTTGLEKFARVFKGNHGLKRLEVAGNCLTDYGEVEKPFRRFIETCSLCQTLEELDISDNQLGASGASIVCEILAKSKTLNSLSLARNRIQAQGAHAVARLIQENDFLGKLDLRDNDLTIAGIDLSGVHSILCNLRASLLPRESGLELPAIRKANQSLWFLDLRGNDLEGGQLETLFEELLMLNSSLVDLRLSSTYPFCTPMSSARMVVNEHVRRVLGHPERERGVPEDVLSVHIDPNVAFACARGQGNEDQADSANSKKVPLLHLAVLAKCTIGLHDLVPLLSKEQINVKDKESKKTVLHLCATNPDPWVISLFIRNGSDPNAKDYNGDTPLHVAVRNSDLAFSLLLLEYGSSPTIQNGLGMTPLACTQLGFFRQELCLCIGRCDTVVVCSQDPEDITFARELVNHLVRAYQLKTTLLISGEKLDDLSLGIPQLYCSTLIVVMPQGGTVRPRQARALEDCVACARRNSGWNMAAALSRLKFHGKLTSGLHELLTPLIAVNIEGNFGDRKERMRPRCTSAIFDKSFESKGKDVAKERSRCNVDGEAKFNEMLQHALFRDATLIDMSEWASDLLAHNAKERDAEKNDTFKHRDLISRIGKRKLGRKEMLDKLRENRPRPNEAVQDTAEDLALRIKSHAKRRKDKAIADLLHAVGNLGSQFELRSLLARGQPFAFILDSSGGRYYDLALDLREKLDAQGILCWPWPHKTMYQAMLTQLDQGNSTIVAVPPVDDIVWDGLKKSSCVINLVPDPSMKNANLLSEDVAGLLEKACGVICAQELPVTKVVLHTPFDSTKITNRVITPSSNSSTPCPIYAAPAISYVATKKQQKKFHHHQGNGSPSNLFYPSNVPPLTAFLRACLRKKEKGYGDVLEPEATERDNWDPAQYEARINELKAELCRKERLLASSRSLNVEFANTVERYKQRFEDAVKVLNPPPTLSSAEKDFQILAQEQLRLEAGSALPHEPIHTDVFERVGPALGFHITQKVWTREQVEAWIKKRKRFAEKLHAATMIQSAWRAAWARELLRRDKEEHSARVIQKCFRLYRWRKLAWMY